MFNVPNLKDNDTATKDNKKPAIRWKIVEKYGRDSNNEWHHHNVREYQDWRLIGDGKHESFVKVVKLDGSKYGEIVKNFPTLAQAKEFVEQQVSGSLKGNAQPTAKKGSENNPTKRIQQLETQLKQLQDEYDAFRKGELYEANSQRNDAQDNDYQHSTPETRKALKEADSHYDKVMEKDIAYRQKGSAILQELHNLKMANDTQYKAEQDAQQRKEQERIQKDKEYLEKEEKQRQQEQQAQAKKQAVIDDFLRSRFGSESALQAKKASALLNKTQKVRLPDGEVFTGSRADFLIKMAQDGFHSEDGMVRVKYDGKVSREIARTTKHASLVNEDGDTYKITNTERTFFDWYVQSGNLKQQKQQETAQALYSKANEIRKAKKYPETAKKVREAVVKAVGEKNLKHISVIPYAKAVELDSAILSLNGIPEGMWIEDKKQIALVIEAFADDPQLAAFVAWHELGHRGIGVQGRNAWRKVLRYYGKNNLLIGTVAKRFYDQYHNQEKMTDFTIDDALEECFVDLYGAYKTGDWATFEQRNGIKIPDSVKKYGDRNVIQRLWNELKAIVSRIFGIQSQALSDKQMFALLRGLDGVQGYEFDPKGSLKGERRYSLSTKADSDFAKAVDAIAKGGYWGGKFVRLGTTPDAFVLAGMPKNAPVEIDKRVIDKVLDGKHIIPAEVLKRLPEQLNNPIAILKSSPQSTNPDGFVVLTELMERNDYTNKDMPIVVSLFVKEVGNALEVVKISSVYGKDGGKASIANFLNRDKVLYWDKNKGSQYLNSLGLYLPPRLNSDENLVKHNIKTNDDLSQVKTRFSLASNNKAIARINANTVRNITEQADFEWLEEAFANNWEDGKIRPQHAKLFAMAKNSKTIKAFQAALKSIKSALRFSEIPHGKEELNTFSGFFENVEELQDLKQYSKEDLQAIADNANFQAWFKDAHKAFRNTDGTPKVFYRGMSDIDQSDIRSLETNADNNDYGAEFYTDNAIQAETYFNQDGYIQQVAINAKKPFIVPHTKGKNFNNLMNGYSVSQAVRLFKMAEFDTKPANWGSLKVFSANIAKGDDTVTFYLQDSEKTGYELTVDKKPDDSAYRYANGITPIFIDVIAQDFFSTNFFVRNLQQRGKFDSVIFKDIEDTGWQYDGKNGSRPLGTVTAVWGTPDNQAYAKELGNKGTFSKEDKRIFYSLKNNQGATAGNLNNKAQTVPKSDKLEVVNVQSAILSYLKEKTFHKQAKTPYHDYPTTHRFNLGETPNWFKQLNMPLGNIYVKFGVLEKLVKSAITKERKKSGSFPYNISVLLENIDNPTAIFSVKNSNTKFIVLNYSTNTNSLNFFYIKKVKDGLEVNNGQIVSLPIEHTSEIRAKILGMINNDTIYFHKQDFYDAFQKFIGLTNYGGRAFLKNFPDSVKTNEDFDEQVIEKRKEKERLTAKLRAELEETAKKYGGEVAYNLAKANGKTYFRKYENWLKVRTPSFKAWFGDWENDPENASKVIHPDTGEPLVVYHGTSKFGFTEFKKYNDVEQLGIYFSDNPYISASYYGKQLVLGRVNEDNFDPMINEYIGKNSYGLYGCFLNIRNPKVFDYKGNSWNNYNAQFHIVNKENGELIKTFETYEDAGKFVKKYQKDTGVQVLIEIDKPQSHKTRHLVKDVEKNNENGEYDGTWFQNVIDIGGHGSYSNEQLKKPSSVFVAFEPNQIKSATDNIGTFDAKNHDIRYSLKNAKSEPIPAFGENFDEFYHKGQQAVEKLLKEKHGQVVGAFQRNELGDIDLVWGEVAKQGNKITGYGLSKIIVKHKGDFAQLTGKTLAEKIANGLNEIISKGKVSKTHNGYNIEYNGYKVGLNQGWNIDGKKIGNNKWVVTAFDTDIQRKRQGSNSVALTEDEFLSSNSVTDNIAKTTPTVQELKTTLTALKATAGQGVFDSVATMIKAENAFDAMHEDTPKALKYSIGKSAQQASIAFGRELGTIAKQTYSNVKSTVQKVRKNKEYLSGWRVYLGNKWQDSLNVQLQFLGRRHIVDIFDKVFKGRLKKYSNLVADMDAMKNSLSQKHDDLVRDWGKLPTEENDKLVDLMHRATLAKYDPDTKDGQVNYKANWNNKVVKNIDTIKALHRDFAKLSPDAKKIYRQVRDNYKSHYKRVQVAMQERILRLTDGMDNTQRKAIVEKMNNHFDDGLQGVYFPLQRFGDYVVVVKDKAGRTVSVGREETRDKADELRRQYMRDFSAANGYKVLPVQLSKDYVQSRDGAGRAFIQNLIGEFANRPDLLDGDQFDEVADIVEQMWLASMPDLSWAKHGIHRKGMAGFSEKARRAYAHNMIHGTNYLARLTYSDQLQTALDDMQKFIDENADKNGFNQVVAQRVQNEMEKRHENLMRPNTHPLATKLTGLGFVWYLGLSPASALVNVTQTWLVGLPIIAAKYQGNNKNFTDVKGWKDDTVALFRVASELFKASKQTAKGWKGNPFTHWNDWTFDLSGSLNSDEQAAFDRAVADGTIDTSQAYDLAGIADGHEDAAYFKYQRFMRGVAKMFHEAEVFNRQATFIAVYRLARQKGMTSEAAYQEAKDLTYKSHFDYATSNRARVLQGNWQRVIFLFKQFGFNMLYTVYRNAYVGFLTLPENISTAYKHQNEYFYQYIDTQDFHRLLFQIHVDVSLRCVVQEIVEHNVAAMGRLYHLRLLQIKNAFLFLPMMFFVVLGTWDLIR